MKNLLPLLALAAILCGCAGTKANRVAYMTTDSIGQAVDEARDAFAQYEAKLARNALGSSATQDQIVQWVFAQPDYVKFASLHDKYLSAYRAWVSSNVVLSGNTNAAQVVSNILSPDVIQAASDLTAFVAKFVPSIKTILPPA